MRRHRALDRAGLTLVELLIALTIVGLISSVALAFMSQQEQAFTFGTGRMATAQNYRFALNTLEGNLRAAGVRVPVAQPVLIYAGPDVVAFNSNYASNDANDLFAVYHDPDAPDDAVQALTLGEQIVIPRTTTKYPYTDYLSSGMNSPAETIVFFFAPDADTDQDGRFVLYRQVNRLRPEVVARNLARTGDLPFFEYHKLTVPEQGASRLDPIPQARLPLHHSAPLHGSPADTAHSAVIDSIYAVRVNLTATTRYGGVREQARAVSRMIRLPNAGIEARVSCGESPQLGVTLQRELVGSTVRLHWQPAVDEYGGERDVLRYVLWRRTAGTSAWGAPFASVPAGSTQYEWLDTTAEPSRTYVYALAAQDCTPALSPLAVSASITIPSY